MYTFFFFLLSEFTDQQVLDLLAYLADFSIVLHRLDFLMSACALGVGLLWGAFTWFLIITAKNQSTLF
jgi:hypothetical protein